MGIFNKVKQALTPQKPDYTKMRTVSRVSGDWRLSSSEAIYAAVSRIANTIAMLPLHLYRDYEIARDDPREKLISYMPNASMTAYFFKNTMEAFRNTEGNAYALICRDPASGAITSLDVLDASQVTPTRCMETREMWYTFPLDNGQMAQVHSSNMIALHHISANGEKGVRPIDVLNDTITYGEKVREFSLKQLESVNSGVILELPGTSLSQEKKETLIKNFIDTYKSSNGGVMVIEGGMQAKTLNRSPVDAGVLDVERVTKNRVATVYGIPPHMLGDYTDATYSTAEQSQQEYLDMTIIPIIVQWQEEMNLKLLTWDEIKNGYAFRFDVTGMKAADMATTAEKYQKAIRGGWMRVNEVRRREGLPPDDDGDTLLVSKDLAPLSAVRNGEEM